MFSTTIKRSVATLGVVAGVLAAAVPASAQIGPATMGNALPAGSISGAEMTDAILSVKTPGPSEISALSVGSAEVFELNTLGGNDTLYARGTQVGSEGVKAPTNAPAPIDSGPGDDNIWNNGDGNDTLYARGTQVGSEGVKAPTKAKQTAKSAKPVLGAWRPDSDHGPMW